MAGPGKLPRGISLHGDRYRVRLLAIGGVGLVLFVRSAFIPARKTAAVAA